MTVFHLFEKALGKLQILQPLSVHSIHLSELGLNGSFLYAHDKKSGYISGSLVSEVFAKNEFSKISEKVGARLVYLSYTVDSFFGTKNSTFYHLF